MGNNVPFFVAVCQLLLLSKTVAFCPISSTQIIGLDKQQKELLLPLSVSESVSLSQPSKSAAWNYRRFPTSLSMARRSNNSNKTRSKNRTKSKSGGGKKGDKNGPKAAGNNAKGDRRSGLSTDIGDDTRAPSPSQATKVKSTSPPWQVVSQKHMKQQVQAEKQRRNLAQQGIHQTPDEMMENQKELTLSTAFLDPVDKSLLAWKRYSPTMRDDVEFVGGYLDYRLPPRLGVPEVAFLGRSNVGKSSLLNKLVGSDAARVGKTPGATASVNLYNVMQKEKTVLGLVDLPGFGYAKLSKTVKESVQQAAENYLGRRKELALGILLVDARRVPSDDDRAVLAALFDMGVTIIVVATKIDKLSATQLNSSLETIRVGLGLPIGQPFSVSSVTGRGVKELWKIVMEVCEDRVAVIRKEMLKDTSGLDDDDDEFDPDDPEMGYDMGYDWIHGSESVMYEGDSGDYDGHADEKNFEDEGDFDTDDVVEESNPDQPQKMNIRSLRKQVKELERQGKI